MSLDVYLELEGVQNLPEAGVIPIREGGQTRLISRDEWDARFPGREPMTVILPPDDKTVYTNNITHNLNTMADRAGIYEHLWRPDELEIERASELIVPLCDGLAVLKADPAYFKQFDSPNGWGTYEGLVEFVASYLNACKRWPNAKVQASR